MIIDSFYQTKNLFYMWEPQRPPLNASASLYSNILKAFIELRMTIAIIDSYMRNIKLYLPVVKVMQQKSPVKQINPITFKSREIKVGEH